MTIPSVAAAGDRLAVRALAEEIVDRLDELRTFGRDACLDLTGLPLAPAEVAALATLLGKGEVRAELTLLGRTVIQETAIAGVWWIEHRSDGGCLQALQVEIARVPEMIKPHPDEIDAGVARLRTRLAEEGDRRP